MPNFCSNNLKVVGKPEAVVNFINDNFDNKVVSKDNNEKIYVLDF